MFNTQLVGGFDKNGPLNRPLSAAGRDEDIDQASRKKGDETLGDDSGTIWNLESKRFDKLIEPMREKENGYVYQTFADFSLNEGEYIGYGLEEWMTE